MHVHSENMCKIGNFYANLEASISLESQSSVEVLKLECFFHVPWPFQNKKMNPI